MDGPLVVDLLKDRLVSRAEAEAVPHAIIFLQTTNDVVTTTTIQVDFVVNVPDALNSGDEETNG